MIWSAPREIHHAVGPTRRSPNLSFCISAVCQYFVEEAQAAPASARPPRQGQRAFDSPPSLEAGFPVRNARPLCSQVSWGWPPCFSLPIATPSSLLPTRFGDSETLSPQLPRFLSFQNQRNPSLYHFYSHRPPPCPCDKHRCMLWRIPLLSKSHAVPSWSLIFHLGGQ